TLCSRLMTFSQAPSPVNAERRRLGGRRAAVYSGARMDSPLGSPLRRKEDQRFVTGRGRYVDDLRFPGLLHAAFVRSPHAHARVRSIDTGAARAMASVVAVYTTRDLPECAKPIPPSAAAPAGFNSTTQ